jgi:hypothetical protein
MLYINTITCTDVPSASDSIMICLPEVTLSSLCFFLRISSTQVHNRPGPVPRVTGTFVWTSNPSVNVAEIFSWFCVGVKLGLSHCVKNIV